MTENIDSFRDEVESHLNKENFNIFTSKRNSESESISEIFWNDEHDWKNFFLIAKKEGVQTIIEEVEVFSEDDLESFGESWDDDVSSELEIIQSKLLA